ncbi:MAG TPA: winged helix-turn-helix domain-containing protein [Candidatus Koribacter sp.]
MAQASSSLGSKARFGPYAVDLRTAELRKHDLRVKLPGRPFAILAMLLEHPGEIVTRDEIRTRLWPDGTFVDFENNINSAIGKLRGALSDCANSPQYIETAGRGYRFKAPVEWIAVPLPQPPTVTVLTAPIQPRKPWKGYLAATVLLVACVLGWTALRERHTTRPPLPSARVMIAVLPFRNLTGDPSQEYLSDGLTEEVITQIGNLNQPSLGVIAPASVMYYKNGRTLDQVKRQLGVKYVMEGGLRRDGDHVRVTAQLIELDHETNVWSRQYDRELKGLLTLQDEIASDIAHEVQRTFAPNSPASHTAQAQDYAAYDLFLKAEYFFNQRTVPGFNQAITYYEQAVAKDPKYARAWAGLSAAYSLLPGYRGTPQTETIDKARGAALQALKLDPNLPEAHTAMALILQNYDWNWSAAESEFRQAIALNPSYATAHHWYAEHLAFRGRFDEALKESDEARRLDPLSLIIASDRGAIYYYSRQYDRAVQQWRSVLDLDPNFPRAQMILLAYVQTHSVTDARTALDHFTAADSVWHFANLAFLEGRIGDPAKARSALVRLESLKKGEATDPRIFAVAWIGVGDKARALDCLEQAYAQHSTELNALKVDPEYDLLRGEPRFQKLLAKVGLAQ